MAIVRHVSIRNFRGIKALDWSVPTRLTCLIGPGDSTKTTVLDAVELALSPKWNVQIDDADRVHGVEPPYMFMRTIEVDRWDAHALRKRLTSSTPRADGARCR